MKTAHNPQMERIASWDEVPEFASEEAAAAYWDTHSLSAELVEQMAGGPGDPDLPPPRPRDRARLISLRLDPDVRERLKTIARERGTGYQTLLKQWIAERLAAEEACGQRRGEQSPVEVATDALDAG